MLPWDGSGGWRWWTFQTWDWAVCWVKGAPCVSLTHTALSQQLTLGNYCSSHCLAWTLMMWRMEVLFEDAENKKWINRSFHSETDLTWLDWDVTGCGISISSSFDSNKIRDLLSDCSLPSSLPLEVYSLTPSRETLKLNRLKVLQLLLRTSSLIGGFRFAN